jgi:hypothetical protein
MIDERLDGRGDAVSPGSGIPKVALKSQGLCAARPWTDKPKEGR